MLLFAGFPECGQFGHLHVPKRAAAYEVRNDHLCFGSGHVPLRNQASVWLLRRLAQLKRFQNQIHRLCHEFVEVSLIRILGFLLLSLFDLQMLPFVLVLFVINLADLFENILMEYILVKLTKQKNHESGQEASNNELPIFFGFRALGNVIGTFFGGRIIESFGNQFSFKVGLFAPVTMFFCLFLFDESPSDPQTKIDKNFSDDFKQIKKLFSRFLFLFNQRSKVPSMLLYIVFASITPDFGTLYTFYLKDELHFSNVDLANISALASILYVAGLLLYYFKLKNLEPSKLFISLNVIAWAFNCSFFLVFLKVIQSMGLNVKFFCILTIGIGSMFTELYFMPIVAIWCGICPKNLEALSITFITGLFNMSNMLAEYIGALLIWIIGFDKSDYSKLWIPLLIENGYLLFILFFLIFIEFPDPRGMVHA